MVWLEEYEKKILNTLIGMLGSEGKIKVLWTLYKNQNTPLTTYMIQKYTGLRRSGLNRILKNFTEVGLILKEEYGVKRYKLNMQDDRIKILIEFFKKFH